MYPQSGQKPTFVFTEVPTLAQWVNSYLVGKEAEGPVSGTDPLMSAEERVDRALENVFGDRPLTPEQGKWLGLIRRHLIADLAIEPDDFELLVFEQEGATWRRVDADFGGALGEILLRLNEAIAE